MSWFGGSASFSKGLFFRPGALLLGILLLFLASYNGLSENPFVPDRPGFSTGTYIVNPGGVYVELGYEYTRYGLSIPFSMMFFPQANIRFGVLPKLELNLEWSGVGLLDKKLYDFSYYGVGAKLSLLRHVDGNLSLLGNLMFQRSDDLTTLFPYIGFLGDYGINSWLDIFGSVYLGFWDANENYSAFAVGLEAATLHNLSLYLEYYSEFDEANLPNTHHINAGVMYLISPDIQIDTFLGTGLTGHSYWQWGLGLSFRF